MKEGIVHHCCRSITARHLSTCALYTPTGKLKLSKTQVDILLGAEKNSMPGDGLRIKGRGKDAAADSLNRRGLVELRRYVGFFNGGRVHITGEGRRIAHLLRNRIAIGEQIATALKEGL